MSVQAIIPPHDSGTRRTVKDDDCGVDSFAPDAVSLSDSAMPIRQ